MLYENQYLYVTRETYVVSMHPLTSLYILDASTKHCKLSSQIQFNTDILEGTQSTNEINSVFRNVILCNNLKKSKVEDAIFGF